MIARTVEIDLDDAVAGMVLVNPILDAHGGVLLPAGAKLGESTLTSLRRRGVDRVAVLNNEISDACPFMGLIFAPILFGHYWCAYILCKYPDRLA
jgi:hypothetical protein